MFYGPEADRWELRSSWMPRPRFDEFSLFTLMGLAAVVLGLTNEVVESPSADFHSARGSTTF